MSNVCRSSRHTANQREWVMRVKTVLLCDGCGAEGASTEERDMPITAVTMNSMLQLGWLRDSTPFKVRKFYCPGCTQATPPLNKPEERE
jgi:hypothetical protein